MNETSKLKQRWIRDGIYDTYIKGNGIDIGCGRMPPYNLAYAISDENCIAHDKDICDAETMEVYADETFDYVYNSHVIEHLHNPIKAVSNWLRILKKGGYLIIYAPHRDLYEGKTTLPSKWNDDHKYFILPERSEPPCTFSLYEIVNNGAILARQDIEILWCKECNENWQKPNFETHASGEYAIELVARKKPQ